jgi:hypothetical protein
MHMFIFLGVCLFCIHVCCMYVCVYMFIYTRIYIYIYIYIRGHTCEGVQIICECAHVW